MTPQQTDPKHPRGPRAALLQARVLAINFLGFAGIILILYGTTVFLTGEKYKYLEVAAEATANCATLLGVILTASSVWLPTNTRGPDDFSIYISAPLVVIAAAAVLLFYLAPSTLVWFLALFGLNGGPTIPAHVFNGFAVLGLAGGLFRTVSR